MKKLLALSVLLFSGLAQAQLTQFLPRSQYSTSKQADAGSIQMYVDTLGKDTNSCFAAFTDGGFNGPCLTPQGAVNKAAKGLVGAGIVFNMAALPDAGQANYPCFILSGFWPDNGSQVSSGGILFDGPLVNVTPTTGSATGTATGGSAGSGATYGTLVNSGEVWTVNNFRGDLVSILTGTGSGQVRTIEGNTGTTITIVGSWTAPVAGSTYAIQKPGWNINNTCSTPASGTSAALASQYGILVSGNSLSYRTGAITFRNVGFSASGSFIQLADNSAVQVLQFMSTGGGGVVGLNAGAPRVTVQDGSCTGASSSACVAIPNSGFYTIQRLLSYGSNGGVVSFSASSSPGVNALTVNQIESINSTGTGFFLGNGKAVISNSKFGCASASTGIGIAVGSNSSVYDQGSGSSGLAHLEMGTVSVDSTCATGIMAYGQSMVRANNVTGSPAVTGQAAVWGAVIQDTSAVTITGVTDDYNLDLGDTHGSLAGISAGTCKTSTQYGSKICK